MALEMVSQALEEHCKDSTEWDLKEQIYLLARKYDTSFKL